MDDFIRNIIAEIVSSFVENVTDWVISAIITAIVTFLTVKAATRQYYNKTKKIVAKNIMDFGLRALLKLNYNEELPDNAKVIFVEYSGRCWKFKRKKSGEECKFFEKIRKTVTAVGGDIMGVSAYRSRDYGVLGVANELKKPVVFNFQNGELYKYDSGQVVKLETQKIGDTYTHTTETGKKIKLSKQDTVRSIMIAIPITRGQKLIGGLTFDMEAGAKTVYQNIRETDTEEIKKKKECDNNKVIKDVKRIANNLVSAYFNKKGEDI